MLTPCALLPCLVSARYGNLAPEGSVAKITGKEGLQFRGRARVFDCEEDMLDALSKDPSSFKGTVVVIRWAAGAAWGAAVWGRSEKCL